MEKQTIYDILVELEELENILTSIEYYFSVLEHVSNTDIQEYQSIKEKYMFINKLLDHYSTNLFPGQKVTIHNEKMKSRARKIYDCLFCANPILPNTIYYKFKPLLELNDGSTDKSKQTYVLKYTNKVCEGCYSKIPTNIKELDALSSIIDSAAKSETTENETTSQILTKIRDSLTFQKLEKNQERSNERRRNKRALMKLREQQHPNK